MRRQLHISCSALEDLFETGNEIKIEITKGIAPNEHIVAVMFDFEVEDVILVVDDGDGRDVGYSDRLEFGPIERDFVLD